MKHRNTLSLLLASALAFTGCATTNAPDPVNNAMLAKLSAEQRVQVVEARAMRDQTEDQYALAVNQTQKADERVQMARAALATSRSKLQESLLAIQVAEETGTVGEWESAKSAHRKQLTHANVVREQLSVAKREWELARLKEKLAFEEVQMSKASLELNKAEAVKNVDLVAAKRLPIKDYRGQVTFHREEVEIARARVRSAEARLEEARLDLSAAEANVQKDVTQ